MKMRRMGRSAVEVAEGDGTRRGIATEGWKTTGEGERDEEEAEGGEKKARSGWTVLVR
jgi:hypothetical protein